MTGTKSVKNRATQSIGVLLPLVIILGNTSIGDIRIAGVVLTYYRVLIPLFFIALWFIRDGYPKKALSRESFGLKLNASLLFSVFIIWILYGVVTILVFPYATVHEGLQEIMSLMLGAMIVFCIISVCFEHGGTPVLIGIKVVLYATLAIGLYEIFTGNHLSTSRVCDPDFIQMSREIYGEQADEMKYYVAMSVFHNENDFSAMVAVMAPFLLCNAGRGWPLRIADFAAFGIVLAVLYQNNAFICFIAFMLGIIVYLITSKDTWKEKVCIIGCLLIVRLAVVLGNKLSEGSTKGMMATLDAQLNTTADGMGSMFLRINTYKTTLIETFATSKGLGFGAGSFTNYFSSMAESKNMLLNPHCFWLEILSEYGLVIFVLFVSVLVILMCGVIKNLRKTMNPLFATVCASGVALVIASTAPSGFLKTGYYWIPIALAVFLVDSQKTNLAETDS